MYSNFHFQIQYHYDPVRTGLGKNQRAWAKAVEAIQLGKLTVRWAAELYGVPKATLHDHVTGRVQPDSVSGPGRCRTTL